MAAPPPAREVILATTREILNRPEFQSRAGWQQWFEDLRLELEQTLVHLTDWLRAHPVLQWLVVAGLLLLLGLLLFHLVRLLREEVRLWRRSELPDRTPAGRPGSDRRVPEWGSMVREVRQALQRGNGYLAIWHLHRWFLTWLDAQGFVRFSRWKTNADYVRECAATHAVGATLATLSQTYDQIVYAHRDVPLDTIATLLSQVDHVRHSQRP
jgi:hypothetical protein